MEVQTPIPPPSTDAATPITANPPLPNLFNYPSSTPPTLIAQGAEALLFKSTYLLPEIPAAVKYRPSKPYRHPILDQRLTKHRILSEARVLAKCRREGVNVPAVYAMDEAGGWLMFEWITGDVVRVRINEWLEKKKELGVIGENDGAEGNDTATDAKDAVDLMRRMGEAVGKMHSVGVVHGDLTTSNLMLRPSETETEAETNLQGEIVIIDFGLASQSTHDEDRAVDLYVLERAFGSTHSRAEHLFKEVLVAYGKSFKGALVVLKKLEGVRMRGRKRSMLG
ncbi:Kinase-associated endopeptidase 1 Bud32 protein [Rutstroemia sp. NJR-2017a BVV2]|nr:Kinase-associated endopeptidase 1 Bud32 protein [Rutstroemia sp. NJR-2017a BVV2]